MSKLLEIKNLNKAYSNPVAPVEIFKNAHFSMNEGEVVALVGNSGIGKSTLLQIIGLLDVFDSGELIISGNNLSVASEKTRTQLRSKMLGFVYQYHHLLAEFSAFENVLMPALIAMDNTKQKHEYAAELLADFGLKEKINNMPAELSGGQAQRVAIARALINKPKLLLADEPTGNLDNENANQAIDLLLKQSEKNKMGAIIATHNMAMAKRLHRIITIENGQIIEYK